MCHGVTIRQIDHENKTASLQTNNWYILSSSAKTKDPPSRTDSYQNLNIEIGHWFVVNVVVHVNSTLMNLFLKSDVVVLTAIYDTIRTVPTNSWDIIYVHSMFQLLYDSHKDSLETRAESANFSL